MDRSTTGILVAAALAAAGAGGCRKGIDDQGQIGASVGEVLASAGEAAGGGTTTAWVAPVFRVPELLRGPAWRRAVDALAPSAEAAACYPFTFSSCDGGGIRTETFSACTFGAATVDGSVTLSFSNTATCLLAAPGDFVVRNADITVTGPYGGSLIVTTPTGGQTLTRTSGGFDFDVSEVRRTLVGPRGATLFDISTQTTVPLSLTGSSRDDLAIVSGTLVVTHHLAGYSVSLTPNQLTWKPTCTCAVSGTLTGKVTGGHADGKSATVTLTGCGTADVDVDGDTESVTMDRCAAI